MQPNDDSGGDAQSDASRVYSVPALEKGLDVLEFLATQPEPVTLTALGKGLGRSPGELFRLLSVLQRRGWIARFNGDAYQLSTRLFELATAFPPTRRLVDAAWPLMRSLTFELRQSCHLSVPDEGEQLVILCAEAPGPAGIFVKSGTRYPFATTASGRVMLAFGADRGQLQRPRSPTPEGRERKAPDDLDERLRLIRERGYEQVAGEWLHGVVDISWPIFGVRGDLAAVLAMPFLAVAPLQQDVGLARDRMRAVAGDITRAIGGGDLQQHLDIAG